MPIDWNPLNAVGSVLSFIQGGQERRQAVENQERTIRANKEMAEYQYSKDLEMWNRGNEYNTPAAQMLRLKQGGLNPNLVYGHGATGNMATQLPKYSAPTVEYKTPVGVDLPGLLSAYQDMQVKQAQIRSYNANAGIAENKEVMSRTDRQYYPDNVFLKNRLLAAEEGLKGWSSFFGEPEKRDEYSRYQQDFATTRLRQQFRLMEEKIEAQNLANEFYSGKMITDIGAKIFNTLGVSKLFGGGTRRAARGALSSGTIRRR